MTMNPKQIVLITGGGRGLGRAIALGAAQTGAQVAVTARSVSELTETVELIQQAGGRALALPADVTDYHAVVGVVAAAESQLGPIDVLINGAGSFRALGNAAQVDPAEWWREVEINLRGPFLCAHAVLPGMIARRRGRIINIVERGRVAGDRDRLSLRRQQGGPDPLHRNAGSGNPALRYRCPRCTPWYGAHAHERACCYISPDTGTRADGAAVVSAALCRGRRYADRAGRCVHARNGFRLSRCFVRLLLERGRQSGGHGR